MKTIIKFMAAVVIIIGIIISFSGCKKNTVCKCFKLDGYMAYQSGDTTHVFVKTYTVCDTAKNIITARNDIADKINNIREQLYDQYQGVSIYPPKEINCN
jgi:hypothetical protein